MGEANITFACWAHENIYGGNGYHPHHFDKDLFDSIRSSIFLGDSKPGRRRLFTFKICLFVVGRSRSLFVELFSLCQKKVTSEEFLLSCPPFPFSFSGSSCFSFLRASSFCLGYHDTRIFIVQVQYVQNCNFTNLLR